MSFISVAYLLFLALVTSVFYLLPARHRPRWLLFASYFFYFTWQPAFVFVLFGVTLLAFYFGRKIASIGEGDVRKRWLAGSVVVLLLPLAFFKYFNVLNAQITDSLGIPSFFPDQPYLLPLGISFFTFQAISYVADIYRGYLEPEERIEKFAVYIAFFPTLLAGPIERAKSILGQLSAPAAFEYANIRAGLQLILWGVFKKVVIADRLGDVINLVYAQPEEYGGIVIYLVIVLSIFQLFCDFSGYSDMAVGAGRLLGIRLTKNFHDRVYASTSRTIFWQGWHQSLTSWMRDYVFFPLSKGVRSRARLYGNLLLVYLIIGVWHGPTWGFVVWGLLNGAWLVMENSTQQWREGLFERAGVRTDRTYFKFAAWLLIFHVGGFFGVFFRTANPAEAFDFLRNLQNPNGEVFGRWETVSLAITIGFIILMDLINRKIPDGENFDAYIGERPIWFRWLVYFVLAELILRSINISDAAMFTYFRF
jgi:D-alanyl-lipoteichoic acid acyltransferase DltB (MBOAT superfamily)